MNLSLHPVDLILILVYILAIVGIGCRTWFRRDRTGAKGESERDYFLAGGTLRWPVIGFALFATNISTIHMVGLAQAGYEDGLLNGNYELMAGFTLVLLALFFAPFYVRSRVATLPDFLELRYSRASRDWVSGLSIASAVLVHIGFSLVTGAVVLEGMFGFNQAASVVIITLLTGLYTVVGGLRAVVITETLQAVILILGAGGITFAAWHRLGGWTELTTWVDSSAFDLLRGNDSSLPWYAVLIGYPVIGIWYWCTDQTIVQRVLGAKDENHARVGALFAGFLKTLPVFIFVLPGTMALALVKSGRIPGEAPASENVLAFLIQHTLPVGARGLMAAALLAALMSTVSGALNSISTLFSYDLYRRFKPDVSDARLVHIGRWAAIVAMAASIGWSFLIQGRDGIFNQMVGVIVLISPPVTAVFLFGVFWHRASAVAARWTLWLGSTAGLSVFLYDHLHEVLGWPAWERKALMDGVWLFVLCAGLMILLSLARPHTHTEVSARLCWNSPLEPLRPSGWSGLRDHRLLSVLLLGVIAAIYTVL